MSKRLEDITSSDIENYEKLSREWGFEYLKICHTKEVTPYIHAVIFYVGEFLRIHGCLLPFTQHGLEKHNDTMTKDYFCSTTHQGEQALVQIMQKQNRMEHFRDSDAKRSKHNEVKCTNCGTTGHNKLSCISECKYCKFLPFKDHLITIDGRKYPRCGSGGFGNCLYFFLSLFHRS